MSRNHRGQSGSTLQGAGNEYIAGEQPGTTAPSSVTPSSTLGLVHQEYAAMREVSIEDLTGLSQRLLNLEHVCRSYSGTAGDECLSIRTELNRLLQFE